MSKFKAANIKAAFAAITLCLAATSPALAESDDQLSDTGTQWGGLYIGAFAGGYFGETNITPAALGGLTTDGSTNGLVGGALVGYNFLNGGWLFGVEADVGWSNADGTGTAPIPGAVTPVYNYEVGLVGHVRARIGVLVTPETLLFATGGLAFATVDVSETTGVTGWNGTTLGGTQTGWTIGGGVERAFTGRISGRLEYLYDDFGSNTYNHGTSSYSSSATASIVRAAIIVKLN